MTKTLKTVMEEEKEGEEQAPCVHHMQHKATKSLCDADNVHSVTYNL